MKSNHQTFKMDKLRKDYELFHDTAEQFKDALKKEFEDLLTANSISLGVPIESRTKKWSSIVEKMERKALNFSSIQQIDDLIGIRIILLFYRDLEKTCNLISKTLVVISHEDTAQRLAETQFGYQSFHYVISLPEKWLEIPSFQKFNNMKAEVQVRTLAQHIWAAASHNLQYKQEQSVPIPVQRSIYRVSALLETVDLEFERVLRDRESYLSKIDIQETDELLNVDLLEKTLDSLLPAQNKEDDESYSELLRELNYFKINKQAKLIDLINKHLKKSLEKDRERAKSELEAVLEQGMPSEVSLDTLESGAFYTHIGLVRAVLGYEFEDYRERLLRWFKSQVKKQKPQP